MRVREVLVVGACVTLLTGCAAEKTDLPGLTASPTPAATSSAPEPTPTERTATDLSDPELGIVFDDVPDLTGPAASAHDAAAIFEVEFWRSVTAGTTSTALAPFVSPVLLEKVDYAVRNNNEHGYGFDGTKRVTIFDVAVDGSEATVATCTDYTDVEFTNLDGSPSLDYAEAQFPQRQLGTMTLTTVDDGVTWRPEDIGTDSAAC